jgi:hypothetical protein
MTSADLRLLSRAVLGHSLATKDGAPVRHPEGGKEVRLYQQFTAYAASRYTAVSEPLTYLLGAVTGVPLTALQRQSVSVVRRFCV